MIKTFTSLFLLLSLSVAGQQKLTKSVQSGYFTYIYKLTDAETFNVAVQSTSIINDTYFHTRIDSFITKTGYKKHLPYGNYLYVKPVQDRFEYILHQVKNVNIQYINNSKIFQFALTDEKGFPVTNAQVEAGKGRTVRFDPKMQLYVAGSVPKAMVVKVIYKNIVNYFTFDVDDDDDEPFFKKLIYGSPIKYTWLPFKNLFKYGKFTADAHYYPVIKNKYQGYVAFSQPKYKPLDTVKFKAFVVTGEGGEINKTPVNVYLKGTYDKEKFLTRLEPYRNGGYTCNFKLADSLDLDLDENYNVLLKDDKGVTLAWGSFGYEDYELKSVNFSVRSDKNEQSPANPIAIYLKATDENELAVPDGRVGVTILTSNVNKYYGGKVFVPDTLWRKNIILDAVGETKLIIPDSIFPKADLAFRVDYDFRNSNNEARNQKSYFNYNFSKSGFKVEMTGDSINIQYLELGKSIKKNARLIRNLRNYEEADSLEITLPYKFKHDYRILDYDVYAGKESKYIDLTDYEDQLNLSAAMLTRDSLRVLVKNPRKIPFWYTIYAGNAILNKGYTTSLDTLLKYPGNKMAYIKLSYFWADDDEVFKDAYVSYNGSGLNVEFTAPDMIYPGQEVAMQVKVTDAHKKPVNDVDLTAYAFTAKFSNPQYINLPQYGSRFSPRVRYAKVEDDDIDNSKGSFLLNWDKWASQLGLDTIEYYRFTNTKEMYTIAEDGVDTVTQIAPFAVKNGKIIPAYIVYIDEVPVYFSKAQQLQRYSFAVKPGKHSIRLRTADLNILIKDLEPERGKKTILSILADIGNKTAEIKPVTYNLEDFELNLLQKYMLKISDNFDSKQALLKYGDETWLINPPPKVNPNNEILIGPIKYNNLVFDAGEIIQPFIREPGYTFTFTPGLIKQKSFNGYGFDRFLNNAAPIASDYKQYAASSAEIDSIWDNYLDLRSASTKLFANNNSNSRLDGYLQMEVDTALTNKLPYIKNVILYKPDVASFVEIYPGNTEDFNRKAAGSYRAMYLLKDNRYFIIDDIAVKQSGKNYYEWTNVKVLPKDSISLKIDKYIKSVDQNNAYNNRSATPNKVAEVFNDQYFDKSTFTKTVTGRVISDSEDDKGGIPGISIKLKGTSYGTITDSSGRFTLKVPENGTLIFNFVGMMQRDLVIGSKNDLGDVVLISDSKNLQEVVVTAYGVQRKEASVGYATTEIMLKRLPGEQIDIKPMIFVDGLPFSGNIAGIAADSILETSTLSAVDAIAFYGSRAAGGVIIIKTNRAKTMVQNGEMEAHQTMRTNFSDVGFWQPKLTTNENGIASFKVKFPDDITNWQSRIVAINGKKQIGYTETNIRSFKSLSANFISPQFAIGGDTISVIGKLMNYTPVEEAVTRTFIYNGNVLRNADVKIKNAYIDTVSIVADITDSLKFEYTLKQTNGYFDGEIRKIPVFKQGVIETKGYFSALRNDTNVTYTFDKKLGKVNLMAASSVFPALLDEMSRIRSYEYLCNEQLASKLKALLLEKQVRTYLKQPFEHEKDIKNILKLLKQNKRQEGTWGWWQNSAEELWISLHVVEALLNAEKQGYQIELNKKTLYAYLIEKQVADNSKDKIYCLQLLRLLDDKNYLADWVINIEKAQKNEKKDLYERLQLMELRQVSGLKINIDSLLRIKKQTMFGNSYWGEEGTRFWDNSIQNTILAYKILKKAGRYEAELEKIQGYFMEQRKDGQWRNTYESAKILETILPDLMAKNLDTDKPSIVINGQEKITQFPYSATLEGVEQLNVSKNGNIPVYFTAYQQFQNSEPQQVSKDFTVKTSFIEKGQEVKKLTGGKMVTLNVEINVRADADYVMIEVPIPAGCSYENKMQGFLGVETHREYFKEKTAIFCTKLKQGNYTFSIDLMPRYSGNYILNPAKAEMMYFPVFYGREGMKRVGIK